MTAMYGTSPAFCEASLRSYIYYLASPIPLLFDSKSGLPVPVSTEELKRKSQQALTTLLLAIFLFNILESTSYAPFPQRRPAKSLLDHLHWGSLLNNYLVACMYFARPPRVSLFLLLTQSNFFSYKISQALCWNQVLWFSKLQSD